MQFKNLIKKKYDLVFSIGQACSCTQILRNCKLQFYSYPFDWLFGSNLLDRTKMLVNNFVNFINKNDLIYSFYEKSTNCDAYYNKFNDITFNHDFKNGVNFQTEYAEIKKKYDRRIKRLLSQIENSNRVLVLYIQNPDNTVEISDNILKECYCLLQERFKKTEINLLYLYNKNQISTKNRNEFNITNNIIKIIFDYNAYDEKIPYAVNFEELGKLLDLINISGKFQIFKNRLKIFKHKIKLFFRKTL